MNSDDVCAYARITYRQLDHWTRAGLIPGAHRVVDIGSGHPREWTWRDAAFLKALGRLVKAGVNVRIAANALQKVDLTEAQEVTLPGGLQISLCPRLVAVASETAAVSS